MVEYTCGRYKTWSGEEETQIWIFTSVVNCIIMNVEYEISLKLDLNHTDYINLSNRIVELEKITKNQTKFIFENSQFDQYTDYVFRQIVNDHNCLYERKKNVTTKYESILLPCLNDIINLKITKSFEYPVNVIDDEFYIFLNSPLVIVNRTFFFIEKSYDEIYRCALEHIIVQNKNIYYALTIECEKQQPIKVKDIEKTTTFLNEFFLKYKVVDIFFFNKHMEYISFENLLSLSGNLKLKRSFNEVNSVSKISKKYPIKYYSGKLDGIRNIVLLTPTSVYIIDRSNKIVRYYENNIKNSFYYVGFVETMNNVDFLIDILYCINDVVYNKHSHSVSIVTSIEYLQKMKLMSFPLKINNYMPVHNNNVPLLINTKNKIGYKTDGWLFYTSTCIYKLKEKSTIDCIITLNDWIGLILKSDKKMRKKYFKPYLEQNIPFTSDNFLILKKYHYLFKDLLCLYDNVEKNYKPIKKKFPNLTIEWNDFESQIIDFFIDKKTKLTYNYIIVECIYETNRLIILKNRNKNSPNTFTYFSGIIK